MLTLSRGHSEGSGSSSTVSSISIIIRGCSGSSIIKVGLASGPGGLGPNAYKWSLNLDMQEAKGSKDFHQGLREALREREPTANWQDLIA